jgi:hypothetical protein
MDFSVERRLLQLAIALGSLVPLLAGAAGMLLGPDMIGGVVQPVPPDLDSHMRYLSGLLCGIGLGFLSCIPRIEEKGRRFQLLGAVVLLGGAARALSLFEVGLPGLGHRLALGMELGTVPVLMLWQWRVARRARPAGAAGGFWRRKSQGAAGQMSDDPFTWPAIGSDRPEDSGKSRLSSSERT